MEFEEKATGIAQHGSGFISSPERRRRSTTILAHGLELRAFLVSHSGRHGVIETSIGQSGAGGVKCKRRGGQRVSWHWHWHWQV